MPKKCKPIKEAVFKRMMAAERLNNTKGGTYRGIFPMEIFGIKNASRTGEFTIDQIVEEIQNENCRRINERTSSITE
jgi:hypothetical protein